MIQPGLEHLKASLKSGIKSFRPEIFALVVGFLDMMLCIPFCGYELVKVIHDHTWVEMHRELSITTEVHMVSALIFGTISLGLVKYLPKVHILVAITSRLLSVSLLLISMMDMENSAVEEVLKWATIAVTSLYILFDLLSAVRAEDLQKKPLRIPILLFKTWLPAVLVTALAALVFETELPASSTYQIYYFVLYTLGLEFLMASSYFVTIYETLRKKEKNEYVFEQYKKGEKLDARSDFV